MLARIFMGIIFAAVGILWTLENYGILPFSLDFSKLWPLVFVWLAFFMTFDVKHKKKKKKSKKSEELPSESEKQTSNE